MLDFLSLDPNLLFPNIPETLAATIEAIYFTIDVAIFVVFVIAQWKMFKKFGEKPWKSLIPVYSLYITYKHTWKTSAFWICMVTGFLSTLFFNSSELLAEYFPIPTLMDILVVVAVPFAIIESIVTIIHYFRIAESFGKKKMFGVGMIFFYSIFCIILGFGKSKYIGKDGALEIESSEEEAEEQKEVV